MGLVDKLKDVVGKGSKDSSADELGQEFADEIETQQQAEEEVLEEEPPEEDPQDQEWETAYQFFKDWIEPDGFMSGKEFVRKAMFYKVKSSPKFRDRIQHGTETIERVSRSMQSMEEARGGGTDLAQITEEIEAANKAIEAADEMGVSEDVMLGEFAGLGRDVIGLMQHKWEMEGSGENRGE